ncbi:MFS general substrate transporter [Trametes meyenii]|nr:MFS general substrate transporter [Trametes meyenii]
MSSSEGDSWTDAEASRVTTVVCDIEHAGVEDDPRKWTKRRKLIIVATVSAASLINGLSGNIYNPAIAQIEEQFHTSSGPVSLSLSLFILIQGGVGPFIWSALSEFWGRKRVYLLATALCMLGCVMAALSKSIAVLIGMRCIQGLGTSAVTALGAATLADIYEPSQRGTMMGIYYSAPLLGPSLGPILGGVLTQAFDWRATFWFLVIFSGICFISFIPFKDTFRRERSLVYQAALMRRLTLRRANHSEKSSLSGDAEISRKERGAKLETAVVASPRNLDAVSPGLEIEHRHAAQRGVEPAPARDVKLSLADVNPVKPILHVLRRMNNLTIAVTSGIIFAFTYSITYTCSRTLANQYGYDALRIGLILLAFGVGSVLGSVVGGRYSDYIFRKLKTRNGGMSYPEMRLLSTMIPMLLLPPSVIAYGWICERRLHVAAICVTLFLAGFLSICIYSSTLAYVVDANVGRSSSAVAINSSFRGTSAFIAAEVAVPLQNVIGEGGLYSLWAGLLVLAGLLILLVWWKGGLWREKWDFKERNTRES